MDSITIEWTTGFNDYLWFRTKPPVWINKDNLQYWKAGQEAAKEFSKGDREDLAAKEEEEIKILYSYLPEQLEPDEIERILKETISELSAESPKDLGKVMKTAMARMAGRAQGKEVNEMARKLLS